MSLSIEHYKKTSNDLNAFIDANKDRLSPDDYATLVGAQFAIEALLKEAKSLRPTPERFLLLRYSDNQIFPPISCHSLESAQRQMAEGLACVTDVAPTELFTRISSLEENQAENLPGWPCVLTRTGASIVLEDEGTTALWRIVEDAGVCV